MPFIRQRSVSIGSFCSTSPGAQWENEGAIQPRAASQWTRGRRTRQGRPERSTACTIGSDSEQQVGHGLAAREGVTESARESSRRRTQTQKNWQRHHLPNIPEAMSDTDDSKAYSSSCAKQHLKHIPTQCHIAFVKVLSSKCLSNLSPHSVLIRYSSDRSAPPRRVKTGFVLPVSVLFEPPPSKFKCTPALLVVS